MVRLKGLEPSRPKTPDPKSGASTNSATSALADAKLVKNGETGKILCDFYDPHRSMRMLVTVGADARNDRCGCLYRPMRMANLDILLLKCFYESLHLCLVCLCFEEEVPLVAGACEVMLGILALPVVVA
jgi:hypothetical protein